MKIPTIFIPDRQKGEGRDSSKKLNNKKKPALNLEDLVPDILDNEKKYTTIAHPDFLTARGVDTKVVEKAIWIANDILLIRYNTKTDLINNLKNLFERGMIFYDKHTIKFTKRFLFKDNISIYLQVEEELFKKCTEYYKGLGFKQIDYELKMV